MKPVIIIAIVFVLLMSLTLVDESFAATKQYSVYIQPPPSYAPPGTFQVTLEALQFWEKRDSISLVLTTEGNQDIYISWAKDLDERHVGYAYGRFIEVGLGDSYCNDQWNEFHTSYLKNILTHEVGHAIGYDHESQSDSVMNSGGRDDKHYGEIILQETLGENWTWDFQICNFDKLADIHYVVESNSDYAGFSVYLVPDSQAVSDARAGKNFSQYIQGECVGKNTIRYGGTCSVDENAYVFIKNGDYFSTITITMQEVNISSQHFKVYASNIHEQIESPSPDDTSDILYKSNAEIVQESSWEQYKKTVVLLTAKQNEVNSYHFENIDAQNLQQKVRNIINQEFITLESIHEKLFDANRLMGQKSYENAFHTYANAKIGTANILDKINEITPEVYRARDLEEQSIVEPENFDDAFPYYFELEQIVSDKLNLYDMLVHTDFKNKDAQNLINTAKPKVLQIEDSMYVLRDRVLDAAIIYYDGNSKIASNMMLDRYENLQQLDNQLNDVSIPIQNAKDFETGVQKSELQLKIEDIYLNHESRPAWLGTILYWYGTDEISSDELEKALDYLTDKRIIPSILH